MKSIMSYVFFLIISLTIINQSSSIEYCQDGMACMDGYKCCNEPNRSSTCCPVRTTCCFNGLKCCNSLLFFRDIDVRDSRLSVKLNGL